MFEKVENGFYRVIYDNDLCFHIVKSKSKWEIFTVYTDFDKHAHKFFMRDAPTLDYCKLVLGELFNKRFD